MIGYNQLTSGLIIPKDDPTSLPKWTGVAPAEVRDEISEKLCDIYRLMEFHRGGGEPRRMFRTFADYMCGTWHFNGEEY